MTTPRSNPSSPYRNELDALAERKATLQSELARLREQTSHLSNLKAQEDALESELAGIEGRLLAGGRAKRGLPLLDQVRVASPCNANWDEMVGDERVRFCLSCEKNVYNLSSMERDDAEALLAERLGGEVCVRFYQRADGTVMTQDCPEGAKKKRRKKLALAVAGASAMAAAAASAMFLQRSNEVRMGEMQPVAGGAMYVPPREVKGALTNDVVRTPPVHDVTAVPPELPHRPSPTMGAAPVPTPPHVPTRPLMGKPSPVPVPAPPMKMGRVAAPKGI